jgi:hypothetical protein
MQRLAIVGSRRFFIGSGRFVADLFKLITILRNLLKQ